MTRFLCKLLVILLAVQTFDLPSITPSMFAQSAQSAPAGVQRTSAIFVATTATQQQGQSVNGQTASLSDGGTQSQSWEVNITGTAPSTVTITVTGCGRLGTCGTTGNMFSYSATTSGLTTSSGLFDTYNAAVAWTGGDATTVIKVAETATVTKSGASVNINVTANGIASANQCTDVSVVANIITCSPANPITSYQNGMLILAKVANTTTGAATININGKGSKSVTDSLGRALPLSGGEMAANGAYLMYYDGTEFVLLNDYPAVDVSTFPGATADVQISNAITAGCGGRSVILEGRNLVNPIFAANPFSALLGAGYKPTCTGNLLLPAGVVTVNTPLVIPGGWRVVGVGASLTLNSTNSTQVTANTAGLFLGPYSTGTASMTSTVGGTSSTYISTITGVATNWIIGTNIMYGEHFTQCTTLISGTACGGTPATNAFDGIICGPPTPGCSAATTTSLTVITNNNYVANTASSYVISSAVVEIGDSSGVAAQPGNFDVGIGGFTIQTSKVTGVNGLNNVSCQNLCHFSDSIFIHPAPSGIGFALHSSGMQNSGPYYPLWIVGEANGAHTGCDANTQAASIRGFTSVPINVDNWSAFTTQCGAVLTTMAIDSPVSINNWHIGGSNTTATGISVDVGDAVTCPQICYSQAFTTSSGMITNLNLSGQGVTGLKHGTNSSPRNWGVYGLKDSSSGNYTNLFIDSVRGCTIPIANPYLISYIIGDSINTFFSMSEVAGCGGLGLGAGTISLGAVGSGVNPLITFTGSTSGAPTFGCTGVACANALGTNSPLVMKKPIYAVTCNQVVGTSANPSAVACGAAGGGQFSCAVAASGGTCIISTTDVVAGSSVVVTPMSAIASMTCNATADTGLTAPRVASISPGTSFTINLGTFSTNPECFTYTVSN